MNEKKSNVTAGVLLQVNRGRYLSWPRDVPPSQKKVLQSGDRLTATEEDAAVLCGEGPYADGTVPCCRRVSQEI